MNFPLQTHMRIDIRGMLLFKYLRFVPIKMLKNSLLIHFYMLICMWWGMGFIKTP